MKRYAQRILIVDDEPLILEVLDIQFAAMGLTPRTFSSPDEALQAIGEFKPDLILSDFKMPTMDGLEFLSRVRGSGLGTPFFLMTGFSEKVRSEVSSSLAISGIIEKPFQIGELKAMIHGFLEKRAAAS